MRALLVAVVAAVGLWACAPVPGTPADPWAPVVLPAGVRPASLALAGDDVLVGGRSDAPSPKLLRFTAGTAAGEFRLVPADPSAATADLVRLTVAGDDVHAIGSVISGAHSNPRLTIWDGSVQASRMTSHPQPFFTFGGHDAGPLLGTAVVDGRPVIFGSRVGPRGAYGVLWTRQGDRWTRQDPGSVPASAPDRELGFGALAWQGSRLVVAGDELGLAGGLNQQPVVFVGGIDGPWQELRLPVPDGLTRVPGQTSTASSVACPGTGPCWVSGWVRGHALAWPVTVPEDGDATAGEPATLPGDPAPGNDPRTAVTLVGARPAVLTNATIPTLQLGCPDGWHTLTAPPAAVTAVVAAPDALYAVAGGTLWRLAAPAC